MFLLQHKPIKPQQPLSPPPAAATWHGLARRRTRSTPAWRPKRRSATANTSAMPDIQPSPSAVADVADIVASSGVAWPSLILTCALMFGVAYGCGMAPTWLPAAQQQRWSPAVTAIGAGLLLGSALCIILPEGFEAAMEAEHSPPPWAASGALLVGFWVMLLLDSLTHLLPASSHNGSSSQSRYAPGQQPRSLSDDDGGLRQGGGGGGSNAYASSSEEHTILLTDLAAGTEQELSSSSSSAAAGASGTRRQPASPTKSRAAARTSLSLPGTAAGGSLSAARAAAAAAGSRGSAAGSHKHGSFGHTHSATNDGPPSYTAGVSTQPSSSSGFGSSRDRLLPTAAPPPTSAAAAGPGAAGSSPAVIKSGGGGGAAGGRHAWLRPWLVDPTHHALLGLLVHAVSDGLAVGAASLSNLPAVSVGVATAMVVHKGPVALGLSTFLRGAAWTPQQVQRGLLMFAAASPLAALLTAGLLSAIPGVTDNIPLVVLFSGGTVLYAATSHILPSVSTHSGGRGGAGGVGGGGGAQHQHSQHNAHAGGLDRAQLVFVSLGMLLPWVLSATVFGAGGHHHGHHS